MNIFDLIFRAPDDGAGAGAPPAPAADSGAPAAAPVVDSAAAAPAAPTDSAAPSAEAPAAPDTGAAPESAPSLLEAAVGKGKDPADPPATPETPAPTDAKPEGEQPKEGEAKEEPAKDSAVEAQPPVPVTYEPFKLPDGVQLSDKELKAFTDVIGARQLPQEDAQKLVDLHIAEIQRVAQQAETHQREVWSNLNRQWQDELRADEKLGGGRLETSLNLAKAVVQEFGGTAEQQKALWSHLNANGMGNYAGFVRLLHNIGTKLNVIEDGMVLGGAPTPTTGKKGRGWYSDSPRAST